MTANVTAPGTVAYNMVHNNRGRTVSRTALESAFYPTAVPQCQKSCIIDSVTYCIGRDAAGEPPPSAANAMPAYHLDWMILPPAASCGLVTSGSHALQLASMTSSPPMCWHARYQQFHYVDIANRLISGSLCKSVFCNGHQAQVGAGFTHLMRAQEMRWLTWAVFRLTWDERSCIVCYGAFCFPG